MSFSNYEQRVIINNDELMGVQSVDGSYSINQKPINIAGVGFVDSIVASPMVGNFNISRKMTGTDPLLVKNALNKYRFDEEDITGVILYDAGNKGFGFTQGRVTSYSVTCNVGEIPEIQTGIITYGKMGANVVSGSSFQINTDHKYYPFLPGGFYVETIVFLGSRLSENVVTSDWNNNSLLITYDQYESLEEYTIFRKRGNIKWIVLGKDAFEFMPYGGSSDAPGSATLNPRQEIRYPDQSSIKVTINDFQIDPISAFSFSRNIRIRPIYALPKGNIRNWYEDSSPNHKNLEPIQIDTIYPIETDVNLTMIAEEYEIREIKDRIQDAPISNVDIEIYDAFDHNVLINSYTAHNARLIGETINGSIGGELSISLTYKGFETKNR